MPSPLLKHLTSEQAVEIAAAALQRAQQAARSQESTFHPYGSSLDKPPSPERERVFALVRALDPKALIELTALMLLGRSAGGESADKWPEIIAYASAQQRSSGDDHSYVAGNSLLGTYLTDGLQKLEEHQARKNA